MALWKSALFSDIRNKLGKQVVFSMWKGRAYMRSYTVPSNPKTNAQTANRLDMARLVTDWQAYIAVTPALVTKWNAAALSELISGYNRFIKGQRGVVVTAVNLAHASLSLTIVSCTLPVNEMRLYAIGNSGANAYAGPVCAPGPVTAGMFSGWTPATGDYFFVIDEKVRDTTTLTPVNASDYGDVLQKIDETAGTIENMTLT